MPVRAPPLDLGAVRRRRARHHRRRLLLDPAERGDVLVRARAGSRPGWRPSARRGRSPTRPAGACPRPASGPSSGRCRRASPGAARAAPARRSRGRRSPATSVLAMIPCRRAIRCAMRIDDVSSEPTSTASTTLTAATTSAASSAQPKLSTLEHAVRQGVGEQEDDRVGDQDEQEAEHERERQAQRGEHGRDDRVQRRDDRRDDERAPEALDVDPGQEPRGHHQRDARGEPRDDEREEPQPRPLGPPGSGVAVGLLGSARHRALLLPVRPRARRPYVVTATATEPALTGRLTLRLLLRLLLGALFLLLGDLDLRVRVRLADELLAARPAEDDTTARSPKSTFQAVVISCCAVE